MIRNSTTRICSANEKNCTENAKNDFEAQQSACGCLVPCNHVKYQFDRNFDGCEYSFQFKKIDITFELF
jgi:hypothetical protein